MTQPLLALSVIWILLFAYAVFACVDFGAGFLYLVARVLRRGKEVEALIQQFQSPVWEVVNVLLVAVLVALIGFFPGAALFYGTSLLIPGSIALFLMVARGLFLVFQHYTPESATWPAAVHGIAGLFIPAALVTVIPLSEGPFVTFVNGVVTVHLGQLARSPMLWAFVLLALASVGYFSTLFMSAYAAHHGDGQAERFFRSIALFTGPPSFLLAVFAAWSLQSQAAWQFTRLASAWPWFAVSALLFLIAGRLVYVRRYTLAFLAAIVQFLIAVGSFGWAHLPYLMYPYLTLHNGFTGTPMFRALLWTLIIGLLLLVPSLWLFIRMFFRVAEPDRSAP